MLRSRTWAQDEETPVVLKIRDIEASNKPSAIARIARLSNEGTLHQPSGLRLDRTAAMKTLFVTKDRDGKWWGLWPGQIVDSSALEPGAYFVHSCRVGSFRVLMLSELHGALSHDPRIPAIG